MPARYLYTVMADCGIGEFLWRKDVDDTSCLVGGNLCTLMDDPPPEFSTELFEEFCQWARWYMEGEPHPWTSAYGPWSIDWEAFNAEGLRLARRLKAELGDTADVQYVRPWNDPAGNEVEAVVITAEEAKGGI